MNVMQQNPDGSWSEATPLGWQGSGIDWEVDATDTPLLAIGYDEDVCVASVSARTRFGLARKMRKAEKRLGIKRNSVLR